VRDVARWAIIPEPDAERLMWPEFFREFDSAS
jgi:hypothetical protein